jgi:hypothetical protein
MFIVTVNKKYNCIELIINNSIPGPFCHWSSCSISFRLNKKNQWESDPEYVHNQLIEYLIENKYINNISKDLPTNKDTPYICCSLILGVKPLLECIQ